MHFLNSRVEVLSILIFNLDSCFNSPPLLPVNDTVTTSLFASLKALIRFFELPLVVNPIKTSPG